jgi:hypothetical protein
MSGSRLDVLGDYISCYTDGSSVDWTGLDWTPSCFHVFWSQIRSWWYGRSPDVNESFTHVLCCTQR